MPRYYETLECHELLADDQSLHNIAVDIVKCLWKLAGLAENAILGTLGLIRLCRRSWATMSVNASNFLATASILARCHPGDKTKRSDLGLGRVVFMTIRARFGQ